MPAHLKPSRKLAAPMTIAGIMVFWRKKRWFMTYGSRLAGIILIWLMFVINVTHLIDKRF